MAYFPVEGKVIWLTGASSGLGESLAHLLASRGALLALSARREELLHNVQGACARAEQHLVVPVDLMKPPTFADATQRVLRHFGRIDILLNCAGISQRGKAVDTQFHVDEYLMGLNYFGPVALTKQVLPSMIARGEGHIVVVSSLLGKFSLPQRAAYAASKHALHGFFDALRAEVRSSGVAVTVICPGFLRTNASYNALKGDGTPHNKMDPQIAKGMPSEECAKHVLKAIEHRRREVYVAKRECLGVYFSRFAPNLFARYIGRQRSSECPINEI